MEEVYRDVAGIKNMTVFNIFLTCNQLNTMPVSSLAGVNEKMCVKILSNRVRRVSECKCFVFIYEKKLLDESYFSAHFN